MLFEESLDWKFSVLCAYTATDDIAIVAVINKILIFISVFV